MLKQSDLRELTVWKSEATRVQQFDKGGSTLICEGGLHSGSSGGPYLNEEGKVVAMHVHSLHQGEPARGKRKAMTPAEDTESLSNQSEVYAFAREGLVLCRIPKIVEFIARNVGL